jgi:hypothetical protein
MKTSVSKKQLFALLNENSKSHAPDIFDKIEKTLPPQTPICELPLAKKSTRTKRFLPAYIVAAAVCSFAMLLCLHSGFFSSAPLKPAMAPAEPVPSNVTNGPSVASSSTETGILYGPCIPVSQPQKNPVTSKAPVSSPKNFGGSKTNVSSSVPVSVPTSTGITHSNNVTFGQDQSKVSGVFNGPMMPSFINYGGSIYSLECDSDSIDQLKNQTMGDLLTNNGSNYTFYSIKGIDVAKEIAVKFIYYYPCKYVCSDKVVFSGATYVIKNASETSLNFTDSDVTIPSNGKYIGKTGDMSLYSINGIDPSIQIAVNFEANCYADAMKQ